MKGLGQLLFWIAMVLWIGGLAALALIAAPVIFKTAPSREVAGDIFGRILWVFNKVELACAAAALAGAFMTMSRPPGRLDWFNVGLIAVMGLNVLLITLWLLPTMNSARGVEPARFEQLHHLSTKLYSGTLIAGLSVIFLAALRKPKS